MFLHDALLNTLTDGVHYTQCLHFLQEQYVFLHDALLEALTLGNTTLSSSDVTKLHTGLMDRRSSITQRPFVDGQFEVTYTEIISLNLVIASTEYNR